MAKETVPYAMTDLNGQLIVLLILAFAVVLRAAQISGLW